MSIRPTNALLTAGAVLFTLAAAWLCRSETVERAAPQPPTPEPATARVPETAAERPGLAARPGVDLSAGAADADAFDDPEAADAWTDPAVRPLTVTVVDLEGRPTPGVPVRVASARLDGPVLATPRTTRRDGRVRIPIDLAMDREGEVVVAARVRPGAAAWTAVRVDLSRAADAVLRLDAGAAATLRLTAPDGEPYVGPARIGRVIVDDPPPETGERGAQLTAAFGEAVPRAVRCGDGFVLAGFAPGERATLGVQAHGYEPVFTPIQAPEGGGSWPLEIRLGRRMAAVIALATPPAAEGPWAFGHREIDHDPEEVLVAAGADEAPLQASPEIRRDVVPGRPHRLRIDGYRGGVAEAAAEFDVPALAAGEVFHVGAVTLAPLATVLSGRVADPEDRPVAGAVVEALPRGAGRESVAHTDAAGAFRVRGLPGRGPYAVGAHAPGRVSARAEDVPEGATDVKLVLEPAGGIEGRVQLPAGVDAERVRVRALRADRAPAATSLRDDGGFLLGDLPGGVYVLVIDGPGLRTLRVADVVVAPPEITRDDRLARLRPDPAPRSEP
ncbi:MAG TPA: carboxypeptidase regulatory-like domain-containing protein [Planctomycetota bacterium]|nr:carboxypeptidase regulatory-like domain-containing protein [Planctomycetota bacterium]